MGTERFWRAMWMVAVWHNIIGGLGVAFLGDWIYAREGLPAPSPGVNYLRWWLMILVFGYIYYLVSQDLYNSRNLVLAGILGKLASATSDLYYLVFVGGVPRIFWTTVCTDYAFVVLFWMFLGFVKNQKQRLAAAASG